MIRSVLASVGLAVLVLLAGASAAEVAGKAQVAGTAEVAGKAQLATPETRVVGEYCTPAGCVGKTASSALGMGTGFALATLGSLALSRRMNLHGH
ncbi:MAG: hypothetical protein IH884_10070 [Myxococcales bacterium]|nr:hypothetical protein [Myxococcales bacterium]